MAAPPPTIHTMPGSTNLPPARLPNSTGTAALNPRTTAQSFVAAVNASLARADDAPAALASLFADDGYWRDHLALTWALRTVQSPAKIAAFLRDAASRDDGTLRLRSVALDDGRPSAVVKLDADGKVDVLQFFITFETAVGFGAGTVRLVGTGGEGWKIYTLGTILQGLKGFEEPVNGQRPAGVAHGQHPGRKNWADRREAEVNYTDGSEPQVIIVGAGQAGLTAAVRLKMLGINALIVDRNKRVGDNWRNRYHQLVLHDPVWYDHMPYIPFPPNWPIFTPKDKLAGWFESYAQSMELNVWMTTELASKPVWDEAPKTWTVELRRTKTDGSVEERTFRPRHIIQATGYSGQKYLPDIKGMDSFKGHVLCHSSDFPGAKKDIGKGKKAIVVGCCNSGHDISHDFYENGYDVTMVQRSSTHVVSSAAITEIALKGLFSETSPPVDDADLLLNSLPNAVLKTVQVQVGVLQRAHDEPMLTGLAAAGFKVDDGPDGAGLFFKYFQRGGGYYIDVGASQLIADGKIKIKQGQEISEVLPNGLRFADGEELEADEIVLATGYQNMREQAREMYGDELADRVKDVGGLNEEGEYRTMWQDSGHPGFWFHGGNMAQCRYFSRLLALQIKGLEAGLYKHGEK
ncbi:flavin-containing monooxygenase [Cordyceps fumosorosea ARSEF 2679]|uniref:Flavin-containing monooxygenase n=1 Tax=Cordyceps fumosorosea (strain ARSEF 2679) TaxID=1081104 RepID=A0A167N3W1_CORFA|nr:flavin-containing monooxygenase [Cordyceps fumosorosea ARSEF 2679]OAA55101.1 flavin-containing monooxygenase [Cordyceps fumosorosea ARSEF 2679]